jgi:hypothetical protein
VGCGECTVDVVRHSSARQLPVRTALERARSYSVIVYILAHAMKKINIFLNIIVQFASKNLTLIKINIIFLKTVAFF